MIDSNIIKRLLLKVSEGDEISFSKLYNIYFSKVYNFTGCFIRSNEPRKELVADVFLSVWHNRSKLLEIESFDAYLFIIARNKSINHLNKHKLKPAYTSETSFEIMEEKNTPECKLLYKELEVHINKSINELPEKCKLIFLMSRNEGFTYKEIANVLSLSESTVNGQMVIAIKKLGKSLRKYLSCLLLII
jgi:RNA polymerase sigma-70 factor (family 1)